MKPDAWSNRCYASLISILWNRAGNAHHVVKVPGGCTEWCIESSTVKADRKIWICSTRLPTTFKAAQFARWAMLQQCRYVHLSRISEKNLNITLSISIAWCPHTYK